MMDWSQAYTVEWRLARVDKDTWADGHEVGTVRSLSLIHI